MILTMKLLHPLSSFTTLPPKTRQSKLYLVGQSEKGNVLKGLDLGVEGMRVGENERLYINSKVCFDRQVESVLIYRDW
ncbi:hypothetical protein BRARA_C03248 [Brassica rapa]|uniref:Rotamase n=1 Tax=Brassica campestris TaxID=3711 RepID=A0A398A1L8_BRACM|nr:hypothetical protein BRARA_C03248 [Brassica rapa]